MAELKVKDYKPESGKPWQFATVKKGHRVYGEIRKYPSGLTVYWAFRKPDEVFVDSDSWAIDVETIAMLKMRRVPYVGIEVTNGDLYLTRTEFFEDKDRGAHVLDYSKHVGRAPSAKGKLGARQWYLPRAAFASRVAPPEGTLAVMGIKGR